MPQITRRTFGVVAAATVVTGLSHAAYAQTRRKLVAGYSDFAQMYDELARHFQASNPDIEISYLSSATTYDELIQRAIRDTLVGQQQDILFMGFGQLPLLAKRGMAVPLDDFIARDRSWQTDGIADVSLQLGKFDGKVVALPFGIAAPIVYYNQDLIAKSGYSGSMPSTWEEILALGQRINNLGSPIAGGWFQYQGNWLFPAFLNARGGHLTGPDGSVGFNNENGQYALEILQRFGQIGMTDMSPGQARQAFVAGSLGLLVGSSSWSGRLTSQIGNAFRMGVGPFPCTEQGFLPAGGNAIAIISKDATHQSDAWRFIRFATGPVGQSILLNNSGYVPPKATGAPQSSTLNAFLATHPSQAFAISQVSRLGPWEQFPGDNSTALNTVVENSLQAVITQRVAPKDALVSLVRDVSAKLPDH
ncbi:MULTISPECIES: extracellular solute-binding protein [unclassified Sinorhizobium]|uniref:extracellular solute-binding protein n=1 Tax=unclassified Sinorhizobium TaxID=2613772 RepID=UPI0024C2ED66|nr:MULTISPECIES: extracellular solute-binding protein [unclassified Sinorhizobium]MDK1378154.1 extracellular solute-binding protein [Sinorhizobium sp. 6-70]MDK1479797.1 extracellular solute-binding protein [Sinorhizobium sp. 6-117]